MQHAFFSPTFLCVGAPCKLLGALRPVHS